MKFTFWTTLAFLLLSSICLAQTGQAKSASADSSSPAIDSAQANIAFRDIKFGEDYSTVIKKLGFFVKIGKYEYSTDSYYMTSSKETSFNLYRIEFKSYLYTSALYYDTYIKDMWQNLVDVVSGKYGKKDGIYPDFLGLKSGYLVFTHTWVIGTKEIRIGVSSEDSKYFTLLWITDLTRKKILDDQEKLEEQKAKQESSKEF